MSPTATDRTHPAHTPNGIAYIRCLDQHGNRRGYIHWTGAYGETYPNGSFNPLRFPSFKVAEEFLHANPQWTPAVVLSVDPAVDTSVVVPAAPWTA